MQSRHTDPSVEKADGRVRTLSRTNNLKEKEMARPAGLEPATFCLEARILKL
jgi:hypothetical protein